MQTSSGRYEVPIASRTLRSCRHSVHADKQAWASLPFARSSLHLLSVRCGTPVYRFPISVINAIFLVLLPSFARVSPFKIVVTPSRVHLLARCFSLIAGTAVNCFILYIGLLLELLFSLNFLASGLSRLLDYLGRLEAIAAFSAGKF